MRKTVFAALLLFLMAPVFSQVGKLDSTYGHNGISATVPLEMQTDKMVVQPDGKIVAAGLVPDPERYVLAAVARYTATGVLDRSFSGDGILVDEELNVAVFDADIAVQKDGKVLLAGISNNCCTDEVLLVKRYNLNGTRDSSFKASIPFNFDYGTSPEIAVQSNGRIVVAVGLRGAMQVYEYNTNGSLYRHFQITTPIGETSYTQLSAYPDGGYVLTYMAADGKAVVYSSRFGKRLLAFNMGSAFYNLRHTVLKNSKIALIGSVYNMGFTGKLAMLNANGSLDSSFDKDGYLPLAGFETEHIVSEPNGKLIFQGFNTVSHYGLWRLNANGTFDKSFGNNGFVLSDFSGIMAVYGNRLYALGGEKVAAYLLNTEPRYVKVNLYGNSDPYSNRQWNNWNNLKNLHFNNFYYSDSTFSTISAVMSNRNGVNDNGTAYGSGMAPAGVLRHSSYSIGSRTITFSGLAVKKRYNIELYGSRNANPADSTVFTINGVSKKIGTYRNFTKKAIFTGLAPNAQGRIVLTINSTKTYNYLNGFMLTETFPAPAMPSMESVTSVIEDKPAVIEAGLLQATAFPNPARYSFTLQLKSSSDKPVQLLVYDAAGRLVEIKQVTAVHTNLVLGEQYKPGVYYTVITQGSQRRLLKLVKEAN